MNKIYFYVALAGALLFAAPSALAQDMVWPQFLGPQSNPVATHAKLADRWSKTDNVEWSLEVPGRGWSSPIVTGRPPGGRHRKNSFTSETPVTDGKFIYLYVANLGLWAFDLKGNQVWTTPMELNPIYLE